MYVLGRFICQIQRQFVNISLVCSHWKSYFADRFRDNSTTCIKNILKQRNVYRNTHTVRQKAIKLLHYSSISNAMCDQHVDGIINIVDTCILVQTNCKMYSKNNKLMNVGNYREIELSERSDQLITRGWHICRIIQCLFKFSEFI